MDMFCQMGTMAIMGWSAYQFYKMRKELEWQTAVMNAAFLEGSEEEEEEEEEEELSEINVSNGMPSEEVPDDCTPVIVPSTSPDAEARKQFEEQMLRSIQETQKQLSSISDDEQSALQDFLLAKVARQGYNHSQIMLDMLENPQFKEALSKVPGILPENIDTIRDTLSRIGNETADYADTGTYSDNLDTTLEESQQMLEGILSKISNGVCESLDITSQVD